MPINDSAIIRNNSLVIRSVGRLINDSAVIRSVGRSIEDSTENNNKFDG